MPHPLKLEIKFPRPKNQGNLLGLHTRFVAVFVAKGNNITINASVVKTGTVASIPSLAIFKDDTPRRGLTLFYALFDVGVIGDYQLTVVANGTGVPPVTKTRLVHVTKTFHRPLNPEILYPGDDQNIIDERDYFVTYGTRSGTVVSRVMVDPLEDTPIVNNNPYDNGTDFWAAAFELTDLLPDLPTITLTATGAAATPKNICILG